MSVRKRTRKNSRGEKEARIVDYRDQQGARHIHTFARKKDADDYHATVKFARASAPRRAGRELARKSSRVAPSRCVRRSAPFYCIVP